MDLQVRGLSCVFRGNEEEERKAFELGIKKVTQSHSNLNKLDLKLTEAMSYKPKTKGHQDVLMLFPTYKTWVANKLTEYKAIIGTRVIPGSTTPTNSVDLKTLCSQDHGIS